MNNEKHKIADKGMKFFPQAEKRVISEASISMFWMNNDNAPQNGT